MAAAKQGATDATERVLTLAQTDLADSRARLASIDAAAAKEVAARPQALESVRAAIADGKKHSAAMNAALFEEAAAVAQKEGAVAAANPQPVQARPSPCALRWRP